MYKVKFEEHTYEIEAPDPEDNWDRGSYGLVLSVVGLYRSKVEGFDVQSVNEYDAVYGLDDIKVGQPAWAVVVEYTTGSTFGSVGTWCIAAIKKDLNEAVAIERRCYKEHDPELNVNYRPWDGYFESINRATVQDFIVR